MEYNQAFIQKIDQHLVDDDFFVEEFILEALEDYQYIKPEWVERLLKKAFESKKSTSIIMIRMWGMPIHEAALHILIDGMKGLSADEHNNAARVIKELDPKLALKYQDQLKPYLAKSVWEQYEKLQADDDQLITFYQQFMKKMEKLTTYDQELFTHGKQWVKTLVDRGLYTKDKALGLLQQDIKEEWFSFEGIYAVYACGLLGLAESVPTLVALLERDEDMLLEEVELALIRLQSDVVLEAVEPYIKKEVSAIFALSIFGKIKSQKAVDTLARMYRIVDDEYKALVMEALCVQFASEAVPVISDYLKSGYENFYFDLENTLYGYFKVMGLSHPNLDQWYQIADEREQKYRNQFNKKSQSDLERDVNTTTYLNESEKVGRNDPCPCGSGKKYKKCCMNK